ncbi:MAG: hypothetical protein K6G12_07715 [Lachnospiraceae bacterium]|nr:hypothetical protein [Lachnospiraceae bacterium]
MSDRVLIFSSRQLCYNSASYFGRSIAGELTKAGFEVDICAFDDAALPEAADDAFGELDETFEIPQEVSDALSEYSGKEYLAVFDFNSRLPRIMLDDGTYYPDSIGAPFYDFLLDNPLYHHKSLRTPCKDYNVICVDENHADHIRRYYPHIRSVHAHVLGAEEYPAFVPFEEKEKCIIMPGSYRSHKGFEDIINSVEGPMGDIMRNMKDMIIRDPEATIEGTLRTILEGYGYEDDSHTDPLFASQMSEFYLVEKYARFYWRNAVLDMLIDNDMPVRLMGTKWYGYPGKRKPCVSVIPPVDYEGSYDRIAECSILLDVSPFFKKGIHDRLPVSFSAGTIALSDDNFTKREDDAIREVIKTYTLEDMHDKKRGRALCDEILALMNDKAAYEDMRERAHALYEERYSWKKVTEDLIGIIEKKSDIR